MSSATKYPTNLTAMRNAHISSTVIIFSFCPEPLFFQSLSFWSLSLSEMSLLLKRTQR